MSQRTENQVAEMKKQTIGVEVEMNSITRDKAAKLAAAFFGTGRFENTAERNGYCTWSAWDESGREWKFQKDVSIAGPDSEKCEMVTPILTYADIETLQELVRRLRKAGAKSDATRGCGVHIHIGAKGHTPQTLRNLANIMASHEDLLASALNLDRSRISRYCRTVDPRFLEQVNRRKPSTMAGLAHLVRQSERRLRQKPPLQRKPLPYAESPRHLYQRHSRVPAFSIRRPRRRQAERTSRRTTQELHSALPCTQPNGKDGEDGKPQQNENPKYAMRTWLLRLGFIGDEFKTARELLTKRLDGDAAFRSGRTAA